MIPDPVILRDPTGRVASIATERGDGGYLVRVGIGPHVDRLEPIRTVGPIAEIELPATFNALMAELQAEGFQSGATAAAVAQLGEVPRNPRRRGLAAGRLFWYAVPAACEPLLVALAEANEEACAVLDALGRCGDERAVTAVAEQASRKLLSRRRSGVEALIRLGNTDALEVATQRVRGELPELVVAAVDLGNPDAVGTAVDEVEPKRRGQTLDYLYELAGVADLPAAAEGVLRWVEGHADQLVEPFMWRYVKSLFKRASLRLDTNAFGRLARLLDVARTHARNVQLKSGLTGQMQVTPVFRAATRDYLRRRAWRHLRWIAQYEPAHYAEHAAAVLASCRPTDELRLARSADDHSWTKSYGLPPWCRAFLVGQILHGSDPSLQWIGMRWTTAAERASMEQVRIASRRRAHAHRQWQQEHGLSPILPAAPGPTPKRGSTPTSPSASVFRRVLDWLTGSSPAPAAPPSAELPSSEPPSAEPTPEPSTTSAPSAPARPEAYPHLWDAAPAAYLALLSRGRVEPFVRFALDAMRARHPNLLAEATATQLIAAFDSPVADVVEMAGEELRRRLDREDPPWPLVLELAGDNRPEARALAHEVLRRRSAAWIGHPKRVVALLLGPQPATSDVAAGVLVDALPDEPPATRAAVAEALLAVLRDPPPPLPSEPAEVEPGDDAAAAADMLGDATGDIGDSRLDAVARVVADALAAEADANAGATSELARLFDGPAPSARIAAAVLVRRPDAAGVFALSGLASLAEHEQAAVRAAALQVLTNTPDLWETNPAPLVDLAEGPWPDTRAAVLALLFQHVSEQALGPDHLLALLDATLPDVRKAAVDAMTGRPNLDRTTLAARLAEHPARDMRRFALELAAEALPRSASTLATLRPLLTAALLDPMPSRAIKRKVFDALAECAVADDDAAQLAAEVLLPLTRSAIRADADAAVSTLACIKIARPLAFGEFRITAIGGAA